MVLQTDAGGVVHVTPAQDEPAEPPTPAVPPLAAPAVPPLVPAVSPEPPWPPVVGSPPTMTPEDGPELLLPPALAWFSALPPQPSVSTAKAAHEAPLLAHVIIVGSLARYRADRIRHRCHQRCATLPRRLTRHRHPTRHRHLAAGSANPRANLFGVCWPVADWPLQRVALQRCSLSRLESPD